MKKVCIIGHFADGKNLLNGQTVKTKIIHSELVKHLGTNEVDTIDTHGGIKALIEKIDKYFCAFRSCRNIIMLPAENGLRVLTPFFAAVNLIYKRKIHYVVIGGWLPEFIKKKPILRKLLSDFECIYVETNAMKNSLYEVGINNVKVIPNCKNIDIVNNTNTSKQDFPLRVCTFSRIMREKGIEEAVKAVESVNKKYGEKVYSLDIFGQIDEKQKDWFENLEKSFPTEIRYGGLVEFDKSTEVLKNYFALLFPTYYEGEGFAGTLIDAFAAGVPVIASDWKYNSEIVDENTGVLCKPRNVKDLETILINIAQNQNEWNLKKKACIKKAQIYLPENALKNLLDEVK